MSEPTPTPDPAPEPMPEKPQRHPVRINWRRVRVYFWSIALMTSMWFAATIFTIRFYPKRMVEGLLSQLPYPATVGDVAWVNRRTLQINNVNIGGYFHADAIIVTASPLGLLQRHVAQVEIQGGQLFTGPLYTILKQHPSDGAQFRGWDWVIGRLVLSRGVVMLDNIVEGTSIPVRMGIRHPIILRSLHLGQSNNSADMDAERVVEIGAVNISSPFDPLAPVLGLPLTRVRFSYEELWHHHIREIDVVKPTIYLGEDLFWFTKQFKQQIKPTAEVGPSSPWTVGDFEIQYGQLAVNVFGQSVAHMPFFFDTQVQNIRLDQLNKINAKASIPIRRLSQEYSDYKIRIVDLSGNLYFSLPVSDANASNVVNSISIKEISWNDIPVQNVSSNVTFDANGVYGEMDGECEGGLLNGNFEFYYTKGFTWNANFFAQNINCQPIAEKMAGRYCNLNGILNGEISVQGQATEILNCTGLLQLPNPGLLEIKSMDNLLGELPPNTISIKRDALKIAIDSFRDYPFESGSFKVGYTPAGGSALLKLTGPRGDRQFEVAYHPYNMADADKSGGDKTADDKTDGDKSDGDKDN